MILDGIDLVGHTSQEQFVETTHTDVYTPLKIKKEPRLEDELTRGTTSLPIASDRHLKPFNAR